MDNYFRAGDSVICVSDNFPLIKEYSTGSDVIDKPKVNEILTVDEVLGVFLRFEKYDTELSCNWWHHSRFRKATGVDALEVAVSEYKDQLEIESKNFGGL